LKWVWPIIIFFFSILGLGLYLWTCRPPKIGEKRGEEAQDVHHEYVTTPFRKVTGAVIHCVLSLLPAWESVLTHGSMVRQREQKPLPRVGHEPEALFLIVVRYESDSIL
jgi:hypothetical protein